MSTSAILAHAKGYGCAALIVNQVVISEYVTTAEVGQVAAEAHKLCKALRVSLVECTVDVPEELDGKWQWVDLLPLLPPVARELERHPLVVYGWQEGGIHPDTPEGPGDAWDELYFDVNPPMPGTPFQLFVPVCESRPSAETSVRTHVIDEFKHWLNDRRALPVAEAFHDIVAKVGALTNLTQHPQAGDL